MTDVDLLVIGAGPTGLTLAVEAARHGLDFRVVDRRTGSSIHSKALAIQPRTLEVFDDLGLAEAAVAGGTALTTFRVHVDGEEQGTLAFDGIESPYPSPLVLSQSETERLLAERLETLGAEVERETELIAFRRGRGALVVALERSDGSVEEVATRRLAGCDGAHSTVRHGLGLPFRGTAYPEEFILGDVRIGWDRGAEEGHLFLSGGDLLAVVPMPGDGRIRLIATRARNEETGADPDLDEFRAMLRSVARLEARLEDPTWLARFRLHRRIAPRFRSGDVFLLGDAAHIHSPVGGQGMNTGVQDAYNLGWKLGLVRNDRASESLLESYDAERRPVAETILRWTDIVFRIALGQSRASRMLRRLGPRLALTSRAFAGVARRRVSQIAIAYEDSPIVAEGAGAEFADGPGPGSRAPDGVVHGLHPADGDVRLFGLFRGIHHTLLVFVDPVRAGEVERMPEPGALARLLEHAFGSRAHVAVIAGGRTRLHPGADASERVRIAMDPERTTLEAYGIVGGALVLVRPDGHIGYRGPLDPGPLVRFLDRYR